ncbi:MAG: hypothetical protein LZF63_12675, partial [Nitrosomonas sp.]|nr:hypothetical protein [Nitrosomonas sp.]
MLPLPLNWRCKMTLYQRLGILLIGPVFEYSVLIKVQVSSRSNANEIGSDNDGIRSGNMVF